MTDNGFLKRRNNLNTLNSLVKKEEEAFKPDDLDELYYDVHKIRKKSGGFRWIHKPSPNLGKIQQFILKRITELHLPFPLAARAFIKGRRVEEAFKPHAYGVHGVKIDIKNFFHSCKKILLVESELFSNASDHLMEACLEFCFIDVSSIYDVKEGPVFGLPQGACTSPAISNLCLSNFDRRAKRLFGGSISYTYTRYSDDMVFSSHNERDSFPPESIYHMALRLIEEYGFFINTKKTKIWKKSDIYRLCGAVVLPSEWMDSANECEMKYGRFSYPRVKRNFWRGRLHKMKRDISDGVCGLNQWVDKKGATHTINWSKITGNVNWMRTINKGQAKKVTDKYNDLRRIHGKRDI